MDSKIAFILMASLVSDTVLVHGHNGRSSNNQAHVNKRVKEWKNRTSYVSASGNFSISPSMKPSISDQISENCTPTCAKRMDAKFARIEKIKEDLLQKLGFKRAPNATADLPNITPHLQNLFDKWGLKTGDAGVQGDGNEYANYSDGQEVDAAQTERVYSFATQRKLFPLRIIFEHVFEFFERNLNRYFACNCARKNFVSSICNFACNSFDNFQKQPTF